MEEFVSLYLPLFILLGLVVFGFGFSSRVHKKYQETYGRSPLMKSYAAIQGFCLVWFVFEYDWGYSKWFLYALLSVLVSFGLGMLKCASQAKLQGASSSDIKIAVAAQVALSIGIAVVIFIFFLEFMYQIQKKKGRR